MGLHTTYYGKDAEPTRQERDWQIIGEAADKCAAEVGAIVDDFHRQWAEKEMRADSYEVVANKPRIRPARNYRDSIGGDDA
jgi:hypothetical protein